MKLSPELKAELVKLSFDLHALPFMKERENERRNKALAGASVGVGAGLGAFALSKPGIRATMKNVLKNNADEAAELINKPRAGMIAEIGEDTAKDYEATLRAQAKVIAAQLRDKGIDPATARIGVAGIGGSGKSTLARMVAEEASMDARSLDDLTKGPSSLVRNQLATAVEKLKSSGKDLATGSVYDQKRILTELNPDHFDAIVNIQRPVARAEKQLIERGRGAWQADMLDNDKAQRMTDYAFNASKGDATDLGDGVAVKLKPEGGFGLSDTLREELRANGVNADGMSQIRQIQKAMDPSSVAFNGLASELDTKQVGLAAAAAAIPGIAGAGVGYTHQE